MRLQHIGAVGEEGDKPNLGVWNLMCPWAIKCREDTWADARDRPGGSTDLGVLGVQAAGVGGTVVVRFTWEYLLGDGRREPAGEC